MQDAFEGFAVVELVAFEGGGLQAKLNYRLWASAAAEKTSGIGVAGKHIRDTHAIERDDIARDFYFLSIKWQKPTSKGRIIVVQASFFGELLREFHIGEGVPINDGLAKGRLGQVNEYKEEWD